MKEVATQPNMDLSLVATRQHLNSRERWRQKNACLKWRERKKSGMLLLPIRKRCRIWLMSHRIQTTCCGSVWDRCCYFDAYDTISIVVLLGDIRTPKEFIALFVLFFAICRRHCFVRIQIAAGFVYKWLYVYLYHVRTVILKKWNVYVFL